MCGIIGYIGKKCNLKEILINDLKTLEYRGYDSAGIAIYDGKMNIAKSEGKIACLEKKLKNISIGDSTLGIAHTRWATHGEANDINSHPHRQGIVTLVHNGIIENYKELKDDLLKKGYTFESNTDSEIISALLDWIKTFESDNIKAIRKLIDLIKGSYALGIIIDNDYDHLYAVKKDSPLVVGIGNNCNLIASDVAALIGHTKRYILIDDYEIVKLSKKEVLIYDLDLALVKKEIHSISWNINETNKNGYSHFMLKEIHDEPQVLKDTIYEYCQDINSLVAKMPDFTKYSHIHICGCGSAMHAGLVGKALIEGYAHIPVNVELASEYRYKRNFYDDKTLIIFISQSGETADTLAALRKVNENKADTLAIVNVKGSSLSREAKNVLYIKAGVEIAVATTKAYLLQVAMLSLIAINLSFINNQINEEEANNLLKEFKSLPVLVQQIIDKRNDYIDIAKHLQKAKDTFFLGRGIDYALSMEGSLKLKEISYIHSEAYPAGELKHGTISLIEDKTNVIGIISDEDLADKTLSNIKETVSRGAEITLLITENLDRDFDFACHKIVIKRTNKFLQPLLIVVPLQLIAFEVAKLKGCDIDKPRNLAKSVTVE